MQLEEICGFLEPNGSIPYGSRAGVAPRLQKLLEPCWSHCSQNTKMPPLRLSPAAGDYVIDYETKL